MIEEMINTMQPTTDVFDAPKNNNIEIGKIYFHFLCCFCC